MVQFETFTFSSLHCELSPTCMLTWSRCNHVLLLLLTYYAHRSRWSIGHLRPLTIALCSGLLWSFRTSWSPALSALLQCLASQLLRGWPLFLFPCGFQVRARCVVLDAGFLGVVVVVVTCLISQQHASVSQDNNDNNERISRALFHVKHAQLH